MRSPDDDDNYGKGDWNRPRNMTKYANNKGKINFECKVCNNHGVVGAFSKPCPACKSHAVKVLKCGARTRTVYR